MTAPALAFFGSHPATAALLESLHGQGAYQPVQTWSRLPKPSTGEDGFFAETLATATTIPHCLTLLRRRRQQQPQQQQQQQTESSGQEPPDWPAANVSPTEPPQIDPPDVVVLVSLGAPGICGHPDTAHGGIVATLLDEAMSMAVDAQLDSTQTQTQTHLTKLSIHPTQNPAATHAAAGAASIEPRNPIYTVRLDVRFKKPVEAPGVLVVCARVVARRGRKFWVRAQLLQGLERSAPAELASWTVRADAMGFWLETQPVARL